MDATLRNLIGSLKSAASQLEGRTHDSLHSTLPEPDLFQLASEALDLLGRVRYMLEPGQFVLADHFFGNMNTKALCAAVELEVPDILGRAGELSVAELATECKARPDRLRQIMRALYNNGVFTYSVAKDTYANNQASALLKSDHWTQWHRWIQLYGNQFYDMSRGIPMACREDAVRCPAQLNYDTDDSMFKYFTDQGWASQLHATLSAGAIAQAPGILHDYPWEQVASATVVDIGGGGGGLIALLLRDHHNMKGAILDTDKVIDQARANFHDDNGIYTDVGERVSPDNLIRGDFFKEIPPASVYTMKWCLHDWDDDRAKLILGNVRRAVVRSPESRLVILESVLTDGHMGKMSRYADLNMMVAVGGKERDEGQWRDLARATGWELRKIYRLRNAWPCAIEFVPLWADTDVHSSPQPGQSAALAEPGQVVAKMQFLEPWDGSRGNPYIRVSPADGFDRINFKWVDCPVSILDARPSRDDFELGVHGFAYFKDTAPASVISALRGDDKDAAKTLYYKHVQDFVTRVTGAPRVIIFDHTLRKRRLELGTTKNDDGKEQPATMVHCDQSEKGAIRRIATNLDGIDNIDDILQNNHVQLLNVWRPLNGPVLDWPLATMDYQTVSASDMWPCDLLRGEFEERGQTATFTHSDSHRWYYLDKQTSEEVTVIKIWDNNKTGGTSKFCAHAAFHHPQAPEGVEARESVEVRCIAIG